MQRLIISSLLIVVSFSLQAQQEEIKPATFFKFTDTTYEKGSELHCKYIKFEPAGIFLTLGGQYYADSLFYFMQQNPTSKIRVIYTQHEWPADMEESYSLERANAISNYLIEKGINDSRLNEKTITHRVSKPLSEIKPSNYSVKFVVN